MSSRRSSRSSAPPPAWRPRSMPKSSSNLSSPSVSTVHAVPEKSAPLGSAMAKLSPSREGSVRSVGGRKRDRADSKVSEMWKGDNGSNGEDKEGLNDAQKKMKKSSTTSLGSSGNGGEGEALRQSGSSTLEPSLEHSSIQANAPLLSETPQTSTESSITDGSSAPSMDTIDAPQVPVPELTVQPPTPVKTVTKSTSWFGSLSRGRTKQSVAAQEVAGTPSKDEAPAPAEPQSSSSSTSTLTAPPPQPSEEQLTPSSSSAEATPEPTPAPSQTPTLSAMTSSPSEPIPVPNSSSSTKSSSRQTLTQSPRRSSWFSSTPTLTTQSPPFKPPLHHLSSIASVDDEVPPLRTMAMALSDSPASSPPNPLDVNANLHLNANSGPAPIINGISHVGANNNIGLSSNTKLTPTGSRFALSLPLLGRAKVPLPLDLGIMYAGEASGSRSQSGLASGSSSGTDLQGVGKGAQVAPESELRTIKDDIDTKEELKQGPSLAEHTSTDVEKVDKEHSNSGEAKNGGDDDVPTIRVSSPEATDAPYSSANNASSWTWWSYIGYSTPTPSTLGEQQASATCASADLVAETTPDPVTVEQGQPATEETMAPEPAKEEEVAETSPVPEAQAKPESNPPQSPISESGAGWMSPAAWVSWYSAPSTSTLPTESKDEPKPLTEAEMIKEEALARSEPVSPAVTEPQASAAQLATALVTSSTPALEIPNPIAHTASLNSKGWMSFFSSGLLVKSITEKEHEEKASGEMEVMDLDSDDEAALATDIIEISGSLKSESNVAAAGKKGTGTSTPAARKEDSGAVVKKGGAVVPSAKDDGQSSSKDPKQPQSKSTQSNNETVAPPITTSNSAKKKVNASGPKREMSPAPSSKSKSSKKSTARAPPNLVLPTFKDTFNTRPRSTPPPQPAKASTGTGSAGSAIRKTLGFVSTVLFSSGAKEDEASADKGKGKGRADHVDFEGFGKELPRAWDVLGMEEGYAVQSCKRVVIIGIHGWFPGTAMRTVIGEPTGTSTKFANMMGTAVEAFAEKHGVQFDDITKIPLEWEGKIQQRVEKLYESLTSNQGWMKALRDADAIFFATHSQGSIVSTHLLSRLLADGHIRTGTQNLTELAASATSAVASGGAGAIVSPPRHQLVCCLALCGIHLGPLAYLHKSSLVQPYLQYFESPAASELFEFQNPESEVSKDYVKALRHVLDHKVKMVYIASLNDQVVPIYSGTFTSAYHPLILRALYIDGDAYHSSDFLSNLLVLLLRIRNAGLSDGGLLAHLSEATAGSLNGVGHSTAYEDVATFSLAVEYLFLANDGQWNSCELQYEPFNARSALNDYEIPWALREVIADERVAHLFASEFTQLRDAFDDWQPRTSLLRDLKRKLEPIRRLRLSSRL